MLAGTTGAEVISTICVCNGPEIVGTEVIQGSYGFCCFKNSTEEENVLLHGINTSYVTMHHCSCNTVFNFSHYRQAMCSGSK